MYQIISKVEAKIGEGEWQCEFICDSELDVTNLPTSVKAGTGGKTVYDNHKCEAGSSAYIVDNDAAYKLYILNNQNEWIPQGSGSGSGGSGTGPVITVNKEGFITTVTITDSTGVKTFTINEGATEERLAQIEQNEEDITQLKSDFNDLESEVTEAKSDIVVLESRPVNNNILINSNFANPVNQRGVTSGVVDRYSYTLDRWKTNNALNLAINTGESITLSNTVNEVFYFFQIIEDLSVLDGETLTLSAKVNGNVYSATGVIDLSRNERSYMKVQTEFGAIYVSRFDNIQFVFEGKGDATITIEWAKLELGDHATPYVPRFYAEELALCRRYYSVDLLHDSLSTQKSTDWLAFEKVLTRMRIEFPTATLKDCAIRHDYTNVDGFTFRVFSYNGFVDVFADKVNHGLNNSHSVQIVGEIIRDAEL